MVAGLQRFTRHALTAERAAATPVNGVANRFAFFILAFDMDERMRIAEQELNQVAFDRLLLVFKIGGSKRMMRVELNAGQQRRCGNEKNDQSEFHTFPRGDYFLVLRLLYAASTNISVVQKPVVE